MELIFGYWDEFQWLEQYDFIDDWFKVNEIQ